LSGNDDLFFEGETMKTLGDLVVLPLNAAIQADVNAPEPDYNEGPNNEEAAKESPGTIPDAKPPENE
jgi:hypothetical protein